MYYRHNLDYNYPERSDEHMIEVKHLRDTNFDENYPFREKGFWLVVKRIVLQIALTVVVFPLLRITHGLRIRGGKNLRKHKKAFKDGAITICNHVFMWDYIGVMKAIRPRLPYFPAWKTNFEGPNGPLIRFVGGMPVPTDNIKAMVKFNKELKETAEAGKWIHFFPEGSMWFFYPDIRPFKNTVFKLSARYNKPIIPLAYSFKPRNRFQRLFGKAPLARLTIGEPLFPDNTLTTAEAASKLHREAYHVVQGLAGITPDMPNYNTDQNIDNYQKTM